ncbi:3-oxoacyl-ACP reductase FabG [Micromonospora sp. NPDC004704]
MDEGASRLAVVSGGSRGIGRATVLRLAEEGFDVAFCYRADEESAHQVTVQAGKWGTRVVASRVDVTDADAVRAWISRTEREVGPISVAVTSAGITRDGPLVTMSDDNWGAVMRTNLDGVYHVCRAAAFGMMKRRRGCIVNISSVSGVYGNAKQTNYSAAKAGIIGFSKALAKEVGRYGIRANVVAPGFIDTDMTDALSGSVSERIRDSVALGRMGTAEEVADLVSFLASDRATYITGSVVEIHGGISI